MPEDQKPKGRTVESDTDGSLEVRLHEDDVARVAEAVRSALRRDRLVDDVARALWDRLATHAQAAPAIPRRVTEPDEHHARMGRPAAPVESAVGWLRRHRVPDAGLRPFPRHKAGLGITGGAIPTLYALGEKPLARELAEWLAAGYRPRPADRTERPGACPLCTAYVTHGLLAALPDRPQVEGALRQVCDDLDAWLVSGHPPAHSRCEACHPCVSHSAPPSARPILLSALLRAGERLADARYRKTARRVLAEVLHQTDLAGCFTFTGCSGPWLQALLDLGEGRLARRGLAQAAAVQAVDGSVAARSDSLWVCTAGLAQLATAWYQAGNDRTADRAVAFLEGLQNPTGGFYGSYGEGAPHHPDRESAWGVKLFLDAYLLRIKADFARESPHYPEAIGEDDGRLTEVVSFLGALDAHTVADIGCGKGRFLRVLHKRFPQLSLHGVDVAESMLRYCPRDIETKCGSMLDIPYPDGYFDAVLSVEALEHAVMVENAVREMVRVLRPGGAILIIDKTLEKRGLMKTKPWEQWFAPAQLLSMLRRAGVSARCKQVWAAAHEWPEGLFLAWAGRKARPP